MRYEYRVLLLLLNGIWTDSSFTFHNEDAAREDLRIRREVSPGRQYKIQRRLVNPWEDVEEQQDGEA